MKKLIVIFVFLFSFGIFHNEMIVGANTESEQYYHYNNGGSYLDETTVPNGQIVTGTTGQILPKQDSIIRDARYAFIYKVSDPSILSIDEQGNWQALKAGTTTITIHVPYQGGDFPNFEAELDRLGIQRAPVETAIAYPPKTFTISVSDNSLISVNRLYSPELKTHLYTTDSNEVQELMTRGWRSEGIAWSTRSITGAPVYRLYHSTLKVHLYTKDANEYNVLAGRGWRQEGIAYRSNGEKPVYRLYHTGIKKHLYTTSENEKNVLSTRGWRYEGVAWMVED